ncbi:MAG: HrcA family transcriptional regulator, partial [Cyanobium sp.]
LQWSSLDDLVRNLARRLADLTGLLSLISLPRRPLEQLRAIRLVPCGERLLVFLVQGASLSSSLQLRLGEDWEPQLPVLERWANAQLRDDPTGGVAWDRLPRELIASGEPLRLALQAHARGHGHPAGVVAAGLGGLLAQPEFSHTSSLLPLVQLVETGPEALLGPQDAISDTVIWIGTEHPHAALDRCAVVQASYSSADGGQGQVAVVGPMRMAYATVRAAVRSVAGILQRLLA